MIQFGPSSLTPDVKHEQDERELLLQNKEAIWHLFSCVDSDLFEQIQQSFPLLEESSEETVIGECIDIINAVLIIKRINPNSVTLDCSNCTLTRIPKFLFELPNLKEYWAHLISITFENNYLTSLPKEMDVLESLTKLNLARNRFTQFPDNAQFLSKLEFLNLRKNKLKEVTSAIGSLKNLKTLFLDQNEIEVLPLEMGKLDKVVELELSRNKIKSLPSSMGNMTSLCKLWLTANQLDNLTPNVFLLKNLIVLDVSYNQLRELPRQIGNCSGLRQFQLDGNPLPFEILDIAKSNVAALRWLYLSSKALPTQIERPVSAQKQQKVALMGTRYQMVNSNNRLPLPRVVEPPLPLCQHEQTPWASIEESPPVVVPLFKQKQKKKKKKPAKKEQGMIVTITAAEMTKHAFGKKRPFF